MEMQCGKCWSVSVGRVVGSLISAEGTETRRKERRDLDLNDFKKESNVWTSSTCRADQRFSFPL